MKLNNAQQRARDESVLDIAITHLNLETLDTRNSDHQDFHERAVWQIRAALEAAYQAGLEAR